MDSSISGEPKNLLFDIREAWLLKGAIPELAPMFEGIGLLVPTNIRCSIGFTSRGRRGNVIGECWMASRSSDNHFEIFLRADLDKEIELLATLLHELLHSALPPNTGHGKAFRRAALALGLQPPMRHTSAGPLLREALAAIAAKLGPVPHAKLNFEHGRPNYVPSEEPGIFGPDTPKKQPARLLKSECMICGYTCRVTRKWLAVGAPHCPHHGAMMVEHFENGAKAVQPNGFDNAHLGNENGLISGAMGAADFNKE